jgi:hypothetical protein
VAIGTRLAAQTDPAVRLIQTEYAARVTVPTASARTSFTALFAKAKQHAKAGRIPSDAIVWRISGVVGTDGDGPALGQFTGQARRGFLARDQYLHHDVTVGDHALKVVVGPGGRTCSTSPVQRAACPSKSAAGEPSTTMIRTLRLSRRK